MKFYLKDSDGRIIFRFDTDSDDGRAVTGQCWCVNSWIITDDGECVEPESWGFVSDVYMKWGACTHWWFKGEQWIEKGDDIDGYYHICGSDIFVDHVRAMCFVWKVSSDILNSHNDGLSEEYYFDDEKIKPLIDLMLDGYTIERVED